MKLRLPAFLLAALLLVSGATLAQLQANFTADKTGGCSPAAVMFTNTTTGASANAVYSWDFGNGNTSASVNAGALYKEEKNYTVTLTVQDGGKSSVKTQSITVYAKPQVNSITVSPVKECLPVNAMFRATATPGSGNINSYLWDFGDGNTQQGYSALQQHTYTVPGKATVSLTVTNNFGCTNTLQKKDIIEILPTINASFSASQTILCRETDAVQFTNASYGPGVLSYLWDFGDGTTSTLKAPAHSFNKKGIYTVKLTVTSSEGCVISNTQVGYINVASFSTDFSVPSLICKNGNITFNSSSTPYTNTSSWEVDGSPAYYYYSSYLNYSFSTPGNHTIKLKNIFGTCPDSIIRTISVKDIPYPNGFKDTILSNCGAPVTVNFEDTTAGAVQWEWNFNGYYNSPQSTVRAPSYNFAYDGGNSVLLKVINAAGCSAYTSKYIGITGPGVSISINGNGNLCGPTAVKLTASSTEEIINYKWTFSDGGTSTETSPEHLFITPGQNSVILNYTTKSGCTGTASYGGIVIYKKPVADFSASATTICGNTNVQFTSLYGADASYAYWYFGDNSSPVFNLNYGYTNHQYYKDSVYTVTLILVNNGNCSDTITKKDFIKVLPPFPKIASVSNTCDGTRGLVSFTQASQKAETWKWDFGDGSITSLNVDQPTMQHTYNASGTYKVVLTNTNGQCSVRDSAQVFVLLKQKPVFSINPSEVCNNQSFAFEIKNLDANPQVPAGIYYDSYHYQKWENDDGSIFNGYYGNYTNYTSNYWYTNAIGTGTSYVNTNSKFRAIFTSYAFGCNDTTNFVTVQFKGANAGFQVIADKQCWKQSVILKDTSKANGASKIIRWDWSFGDGTSQSFTTGGNNVNHQYNNPGSYFVTLNVTDQSGCSTATASKYVEVNGPKAAFNISSNPITITLPVYFYNNTNNYNSYNTQYKWDFGDGSTATDYSPSHAYAIPGDYTVQLIAINPITLCSDTISQIIKVLNFKPAFSFTNTIISGKCPPVLVRLSNNSINYTSVKWDFGDGVTADNLNYPSHIYEKPGKYIITLYVYGVSGLTATYTDSVFIQQPSATLQTDTTEVCKGGKVNFNAVTSNANLQLWDFGDGNLLSSADKNSAHTYNTPGIYKPAVMAIDANGCAVLTPLSETINVHANPVINFSPAQPLVCKGKTVQINASGGINYEWTPAIGLSNAAIASPYASPLVNTTYQVTVKDNIGCSSTSSVDVIVGQPFTLKVSPDTSVCLGQSVLLLANGAATYQWINNTIGLSNTQSATPVASPLIAASYTVTGTDQYKCFIDTAHVAVKVLPLPSVSAGPDVEVLGGTPVQLSSVTDNDVIQWTWSPSNYLNCTNCASPVSTPMAQTAYTVTVKNKNGCTASDIMIVKLQCDQERVRIPNAFTPNRDNSNDVFMIKGISLVKHLVIFGRWGEKVFERSNFIASDRSSCWDGNYKGNPATAGSYVYFVEMQCATGGVFTVKGSVILIR